MPPSVQEINEAAQRFKVTLPCPETEIIKAYDNRRAAIEAESKVNNRLQREREIHLKQAEKDRDLLLQVCKNPPRAATAAAATTAATSSANATPATGSGTSPNPFNKYGNSGWQVTTPAPTKTSFWKVVWQIFWWLLCFLYKTAKVTFKAVGAGCRWLKPRCKSHPWATATGAGILYTLLLFLLLAGRSSPELETEPQTSASESVRVPVVAIETPRPKEAYLTVRSYPWANCFINGKSMGSVPNPGRFKIRRGKHVVFLRPQSGPCYETRVTLEGGKSYTLYVNLAELNSRLEER